MKSHRANGVNSGERSNFIVIIAENCEWLHRGIWVNNEPKVISYEIFIENSNWEKILSFTLHFNFGTIS